MAQLSQQQHQTSAINSSSSKMVHRKTSAAVSLTKRYLGLKIRVQDEEQMQWVND
jgi:hypothetical protein